MKIFYLHFKCISMLWQCFLLNLNKSVYLVCSMRKALVSNSNNVLSKLCINHGGWTRGHIGALSRTDQWQMSFQLLPKYPQLIQVRGWEHHTHLLPIIIIYFHRNKYIINIKEKCTYLSVLKIQGEGLQTWRQAWVPKSNWVLK